MYMGYTVKYCLGDVNQPRVIRLGSEVLHGFIVLVESTRACWSRLSQYDQTKRTESQNSSGFCKYCKQKPHKSNAKTDIGGAISATFSTFFYLLTTFCFTLF